MKKNIFQLENDMFLRAQLLMKRLHLSEYEPETMVGRTEGWPGDYIGRAFLAMAMLSKILGKKARNYDVVFQVIQKNLNSRGYMGNIVEDGIDEQQLSGNSWLLRSMCEAYEYNGDEHAKKTVVDITRELLIPTLGHYAEYPKNRQDRKAEKINKVGLTGKKDGFAFTDAEYEDDPMELCTMITGKIGNWYVSTDVGCAFIMLDGATAAYEFLLSYAKEEEELIGKLKALIQEMCETFFKIEYVKMKVQTHAILSGLRGTLRYAAIENDRNILEKAKETFRIYLENGITENYENYNWFMRPVHTEPCGHIDSMIVSYELWLLTNEDIYLTLANRILYNAVLASQRQNGGFGLDTCVGIDEFLCPPHKGICEAYWCCTMRGGEAFEKLCRFTGTIRDEKMYLPFILDGRLVCEDYYISIRTKYPKDNRIEIFVQQNQPLFTDIVLYLPETAENVTVNLNGMCCPFSRENCLLTIPVGKKGTVNVNFSLSVIVEKQMNINSFKGKKYLYGDLMLGIKNGQNQLESFYDSYMEHGREASKYKWKVFFHDN